MMIKVQCPNCGNHIKAKDNKEGIFEVCPQCHQKFQWKPIKSSFFCDFDSTISYRTFIFLVENDLDFLNKVLKEKLKHSIRTRWVDNHLLEYYVSQLEYVYANEDSDRKYEIIDVFNAVNENRNISEKLYQRYMTLVR